MMQIEKYATIYKSLWNRWRCYYYWYHQAFMRKIFIDYYRVPDSLLVALANRLERKSPILSEETPRPTDGESEWPPGLWVTNIKEQCKVWAGSVCAPANRQVLRGGPEADLAVGWQTQRGWASQAEGSLSTAMKRTWPSTSLHYNLTLLGNRPSHRLGRKDPTW